MQLGFNVQIKHVSSKLVDVLLAMYIIPGRKNWQFAMSMSFILTQIDT